jgi:hypothetical protein
MVRNAENISIQIEEANDLSDQLTLGINQSFKSGRDTGAGDLGNALHSVEIRLARLKVEFEEAMKE